MRSSIIASVLSISLFATVAHAQGPIVYVVPDLSPSTLHAVQKKFEAVRAECNKIRFDAGFARIDPAAKYAVQECISANAADVHEGVPVWHETVSDAMHICANYLKRRTNPGVDDVAKLSTAYAAYAAFSEMGSCMEAELKQP